MEICPELGAGEQALGWLTRYPGGEEANLPLPLLDHCPTHGKHLIT